VSKKSREEKRAQTQGTNMSRFYFILGVIAVVGIGGVAWAVSRSNANTVTQPVVLEGLDDMQRLVELAQGVTLGDPEAPIRIVEFGDYQCPGCGSFAQQVKPRINLAWIESGQASFVFYDFPLIQIHPNAFLAARAARCAGDQGRYWEYHDRLFAEQFRWSPSASALGFFVNYAEDIVPDGGAFEECLKSDRYADVVTANMRLGEELGVPSTPSVMISQGTGMARRLANFDFASIQEVVEELQQGG